MEKFRRFAVIVNFYLRLPEIFADFALSSGNSNNYERRDRFSNSANFPVDNWNINFSFVIFYLLMKSRAFMALTPIKHLTALRTFRIF